MDTYKVIFKEGETTGVYGISLVETPAMESMFIALKKETIELKTVDAEKRILLGAVLIPEKPIYRKVDGKEFNITFPENTIRLASENFLKQNYHSNSTIDHNENMKLSQVTFVESWIKEDMVNDKSVKYGFDEPVGTWFASMKVENDEVWNDFVKTGKVTGFSIDGFFDLEKINLNKNENMEFNLKAITDAIKEGFDSFKGNKVQLGSVMTKDNGSGALTINFEGDTIGVGTQVTMTSPDKTELPVPDGEYTLEDGMKIVTVGSIVSEIGEPEAPEQDNAPAPMAADPAAAPSIKSEKQTNEIFYQLSKQDVTDMMVAVAQQVETRLTAFKEEIKPVEAVATEAPVSLTKQKPEGVADQPKTTAEKIMAKINQTRN